MDESRNSRVEANWIPMQTAPVARNRPQPPKLPRLQPPKLTNEARAKRNWTRLPFGKHKGKSLPQVIFHDLDYFLWASEDAHLYGSLATDTQILLEKIKCIKIPTHDGEALVVEYVVSSETLQFHGIQIVPKSSVLVGVLRLEVIDLSLVRKFGCYDKLGCGLVIDELKAAYFPPRTYMTRKRCEEFFENEDNFEYGDGHRLDLD